MTTLASQPLIVVPRAILEGLPAYYKAVVRVLARDGRARIVETEEEEGAGSNQTGTADTDTQRLHGGPNVNSPIYRAEVK